MHAIGGMMDGELIERSAMPLPDRVEIEPEPGSDHCFLCRYEKSGKLCGDTWHEDLEAAFAQAEYEYGLGASDFLVVHDRSLDDGRGMG